MTQCERYEKFLEENTDLMLKYMLWEDTILEPQIVTSEVAIEAEDVEFIDDDSDDA